MDNEEGIYFTTIIPGKVELKRGKGMYQNYKNHIHEELSLGFISEGTTSVVFPEEILEFAEGDGIVIPPKQSHMCSPDDINSWCFDMLYIHPSFYGDAMSFDKVLKIEEASEIKAFLDLIEYHVQQDYIEEKLIELLENIHGQQQRAMNEEEIRVSDKLKDYIEEHYLEKITLEELEEQFDTKKFAMIRNFRKHYNTTPLAYQLQLKMAQGKKLLMQDESILDVCYQLGFYDQAHFSREFRKVNGITPSAYIAAIKE